MLGRKGWRPGALTTLALGLALALAACGGGSGGSGAGGGGTGDGGEGDPELFNMLPDRIKQSKQITVGSDIAYAPVEFYKEGTQEVQGIDPDIAAALGDKLGVEFVFQNTSFDGIIPALNGKRFDIIMSALSDTAERQKEIDFVDYFLAGSSILVKAGNPEGINSLDDLCGKTLAVQDNTTHEGTAEDLKKQCQADGSDLKILPFEKDTDALLAVKGGRAVADLHDFPVAIYTASQDPESFEVVGEQTEAGPYGIGVRKDDTQLRDALQAALQAIIADGTYDQILEKWNAEQGALKTAEINGGA